MKLTGASLPRLGARDWALLTAQAAAGSVGYTVLLITGLRASAVDAGIILGALPLVSAALAVTLLGERPGRAAGRDRDRHGGRMADDGQPRRP